VDLRLGIRRIGRPGIGTRVIRFRGMWLAGDGDIAVYLTPKPSLVFYRDPRFGTDGSYWVFRSLGDAATAKGEDGGPLFRGRLVDLVARRLGGHVPDGG